jgi:hypothetical protein
VAHTCSDGTHTRLVRDPSTPVGEYAQMSCPRCGWTQHGSAIVTDAFRALAPIVRSPFTLRAMASQLPAKVVR